MTGKNSCTLEKACFQKGLQFLLQSGIHVVEVVTDAHVQIESLMSKHMYNDFNLYEIRYCYIILIL